jgi:tetratricopeptide (TPR) repeat protein
MGQQAKAQDDLRWVIDSFQPKTAEDYYALGNAYQVRGMAGDAVQAYTRAIELDELFTYAYNNRGIAYHKLRRYADAIADFEQTLRLNPSLEKTQENLEAVRRLKR